MPRSTAKYHPPATLFVCGGVVPERGSNEYRIWQRWKAANGLAIGVSPAEVAWMRHLDAERAEERDRELRELSAPALVVFACASCRDTGQRWSPPRWLDYEARTFDLGEQTSVPCACELGAPFRASREEETQRRSVAAEELRREHFIAESLVGILTPRQLRQGFSFATYPGDRAALRMLTGIAEGWDGRTGVYLFGDAGVGKTGLLASLLRALVERCHPRLGFGSRKTADIIFRQASMLLDSIHSQVGNEQDRRAYQRALTRPLEVSLLALDDLGKDKVTEWQSETWFKIFNQRYEHDLPIFITSNFTLDELEDRLGSEHGSFIASRIKETCRLLPVGGGDMRVPAKQRAEQLALPPPT